MPWLDTPTTGHWLDEPTSYTPEEKARLNAAARQQASLKEEKILVDVNQRPGILPNVFNSFLKLPRYTAPTGHWLDKPDTTSREQVAGAIYNVGASLLEGGTSAGGLAALGFAPMLQGPVGRALVGLGAAAYGAHVLPEQAVETYGAYKLDAPLLEKVQKPLETGVTVGMVGFGLPGIRGVFEGTPPPYRPGLTPPERPGIGPAPYGPRAPEPPITEAELVPPGTLPETIPTPIEPAYRMTPSERPAGPARFVQDPMGRTVDLSQLSPKEQVELMRGPRTYRPREADVQPTTEPADIEVPPPAFIRRIDITPEGQPLYEAIQATKPPIEPSGGEISFRAPATALGIPNARQSLPPAAQEAGQQNEPPALINQVETIVSSKDRLALEQSRQQLSNQPGVGVARASVNDLMRITDARLSELATGKLDPELQRLRAIIAGQGPAGSTSVTVEPQTRKLLTEGEPSASTIRSNQAPIPSQRLLGEGSGGARSEDIQRGAQEGAAPSNPQLRQEAQRLRKPPAQPPIRYGVVVTGQRARGHGVREIITDAQGKEYYGKVVADKLTKQEAKKLAEQKNQEPPSQQRLYSLQSLMFDPQLYRDIGRLGGQVARSAGEAINWYSEPIAERLQRIGGPVGRRVSQEAGSIISRAKGFYGELTPTLDPAKRAVGRMLRGGTTWLRDIQEVTPRAAISNTQGAIEGTMNVPAQARESVALLRRANLDIGRMAFQAAGLARGPSGKMQRILTSYGLDVVRRGRGPAWEAWVEGTARANNRTYQEAERFFQNLKRELDQPALDLAAIDRLNQEGMRMFPRAITHIKPGLAWHEVLVSNPFNYLEQAAQRTAHARAFREVYQPGTGLLEATRRAVQRELPTDVHGSEFDNLIKALQGHPIDQPATRGWNAPDVPTGALTRMASALVAQPLRALVLTANSLVNIGETIVGGPAMFLGFENTIRGLLRYRTLYPQLELSGALNRAMLDFAYDPTSPLRSTVRMASHMITRGTMSQFMNELQEYSAAAAARLVTDQVRNGTLDPNLRQDFIAAARFLGLTEQQALQALNARDQALLSQFERAAAAKLTGGNLSMAEKSTLGAKRGFNLLFWFQTYPMMVFNQFRKVFLNLVDDVRARNWPQARVNAKLLAKLTGGKIMQGSIYLAIMALVYEGWVGLKERFKEAKNKPYKFVFDVFTAAIGGPLMMIKRGLETGGDSTAIQATVGSLVTPVGLGSELFDASAGKGRYEGMPAAERVGQFVSTKTPILRAFKTGASLIGLSQENYKLDVARRAFYRWRISEMGWKREIGSATPEEDKKFRYEVRSAIKKLENGEDWRDAFPADAKKVSGSLYARTLLKTPDGKPLSSEQEQKLRNHIGDDLVDLLQNRDAMIRQLARELGEAKDITKVSQPTGEFAIDATTQAKRGEEVFKALDEPTQAFLKRNKIESISYTPDVSYEQGKRELLSIERGKKMQQEFVEALQEKLTPFVNETSWDERTELGKKAVLDAVISAARARAKAVAKWQN